ncbi:MAG TPA: MauE/DoxX family redox-associated membrane protein [Solirubrobacterales bacterium]|nr:MauE/DoxX family redox-associated membrane protein [Solirubrobacterales bacterium]
MELAVRLILAAVLAGSALAKLARPRASTAAMATFGFPTPASRRLAWAIAIVVEGGLAVGVAIGSDGAAYAAAALMVVFAATLGSALLRGQAGAPCACFGGGGRVSRLAIARDLLLAVAFAALPSLPDSLTTDEWQTVGLVAALGAVAVLAVVVLALAREIGMLRLRLGPAAALELAHEGPEIGGATALAERFRFSERNELGLAVFTAEGCRVCAALEPSIESLRHEPLVAVEVFEEAADRDVWDALAIPGAPYAVALERDGTVTAKGTFNNLAQLESVLATAERRRGELSRAGARA